MFPTFIIIIICLEHKKKYTKYDPERNAIADQNVFVDGGTKQV